MREPPPERPQAPPHPNPLPEGRGNFFLIVVRVLPLLLLAACGFHPLYAEREQAQEAPLLAAIKVLPIKDRIGQMLELSLRQSLNPSGAAVEPRYTLGVVLSVSHADLGIQRDASSTRGQVNASATFQLVDIKSGGVVYTSTTQTTSAYNILDDAYAAQVAEDDAHARTVRDISAEIRTRLALFLRRQSAARAP